MVWVLSYFWLKVIPSVLLDFNFSLVIFKDYFCSASLWGMTMISSLIKERSLCPPSSDVSLCLRLHRTPMLRHGYEHWTNIRKIVMSPLSSVIFAFLIWHLHLLICLCLHSQRKAFMFWTQRFHTSCMKEKIIVTTIICQLFHHLKATASFITGKYLSSPHIK